MMPKRNLGKAMLAREPIQDASAQPRTQAAHGFICRHTIGDDRVGVLLDDVILDVQRAKISRQNGWVIAGLFLIEMHSGQFERHRRLFA